MEILCKKDWEWKTDKAAQILIKFQKNQIMMTKRRLFYIGILSDELITFDNL